jgi:hypothetical protein
MRTKEQYQTERANATLKNYKELTFVELEKFLHNYNVAKKNQTRTSFLTSKPEVSVKQKIRHELNCEDLEFKRLLLQVCINYLSDSNEY